MCTKDGKNLTKLLYSETITQVFQSDYPYAESQPIFFTILVQKVSKDDPKVLASTMCSEKDYTTFTERGAFLVSRA